MIMKETLLPREIKDLLKTGNIEELKRLFSECDPNAITIERFGSNIFSLSPMPKEFAVWAKEQGADIHFRDCYGQTPLFKIAKLDGDLSLLIELGADVNAARADGCTPLHVAAARGCKKTARTLLKAGAQIDAQTNGFQDYGHFTPLEKALYESSLSCTKKWEICKFLLDQGARRTDRSRQFVSAFSEAFHRHISAKKASKFLQNQEEALAKLCRLFDAEMLPASSFHDGASPVLLTTVGGYKNNFAELWDFLVPPSGRAQTAQGEVIRIAGRIRDELLRNGGMNWDEDYRKMLYTFRDYLRLGDDSDEPDEYTEKMIEALKDGDVRDGMIFHLCYCAQVWVEEHPEVMPPLKADYTR